MALALLWYAAPTHTQCSDELLAPLLAAFSRAHILSLIGRSAGQPE